VVVAHNHDDDDDASWWSLRRSRLGVEADESLSLATMRAARVLQGDAHCGAGLVLAERRPRHCRFLTRRIFSFLPSLVPQM
jgi:hypothetical protein